MFAQLASMMQYGDDFAAAGAGLAVMGGMFLLFFIIFAVFYVYFALSYMKIAKKLGIENPWWAWIPILNLLLMLKCAEKPWWWVFGFLLGIIPIIGIILVIVVNILIHKSVAEKLGKSSGLGIVIGIFPILIGILAFSK